MMIDALVITHGDVGRELVHVVEMILGPVEGLSALTNSGKSVQDLTTEIREALAASPDGTDNPSLLFIDDFGGSCANAAQFAMAEGAKAQILTGVNLAMLLDYVTWRDSMAAGELSRRLVEKGREAIIRLSPGQEDE
ncbi:PTS mannose transporter subunit IIAB [bacterium]|nr:PTS mannose transporter subunit IIAB [bacterium]